MYSDKIKYIGCDDAGLQLFESQYDLPEGMCYNSYLLQGEKIAVMDSVDPRKQEEWLANLKQALNGRKPDYLVAHHMEPDHSGSIRAFIKAYPEATIVASKQAFTFMTQFGIEVTNTLIIKEGDELTLGGLTLQFIAAPMIHWPEVMMTYVPEEKTLFSADAFGKFGVYYADEDDWACEARRYYFNICGRFGQFVTKVMDKAAKLDIQTIAPLHGPVLDAGKLEEAVRLYNIWCRYDVETEGVLVAYASIHGNTAHAAEVLAEMLRKRGCPKVAITDLSRDDMGEAIEDAFRMNKMLLCCATYDMDIFPSMHLFLHELWQKQYQRRTVGILENGSWSPQAGRIIKAQLEQMKDITIVEPVVTIKSSLHDADLPALEALADAMLQ
ncbi:MAG: FprA family A-type flavoprotein [Paludibacteraceae bacterium]|nr:FprA family A-type flavoprotein [Paludibacteraceae bacterium]